MEDDKLGKLKHYLNVVESFSNEIELMVMNKSTSDSSKELVRLNDDDIELLLMSGDFFDEFLQDFGEEISVEERQKIINLSNLIKKLVNFLKHIKNTGP